MLITTSWAEPLSSNYGLFLLNFVGKKGSNGAGRFSNDAGIELFIVHLVEDYPQPKKLL